MELGSSRSSYRSSDSLINAQAIAFQILIMRRKWQILNKSFHDTLERQRGRHAAVGWLATNVGNVVAVSALGTWVTADRGEGG